MPPRLLLTNAFLQRLDTVEAGSGSNVESVSYQQTVGRCFWKLQPVKFYAVRRIDDDAASSGELCTLSLRYKQPDENESRKLEFTIDNEDHSFSTASADFRFAASVASLGMMLRGSRYGGISNPALVEEIAASSLGEDRSGYRAEFVDLVRQVRRICEQ